MSDPVLDQSVSSQVPYYVAAPLDQYSSVALPPDSGNVSVPGINQTYSNQNPPPPISTWDSIWNTVKNDAGIVKTDALYGVQSVYSGAKSVIGTVASDVSGGVASTFTTLTKPLTSLATNGIMMILLAVVVIGGVLYFIFSTGGVHVNAIV